jgi:hypothetical protein
MKINKLAFFFIFLLSLKLLANEQFSSPQSLDSLPFDKDILSRIKKSERIVITKSQDLLTKTPKGPDQDFFFQAVGLHPKACWFSLTKLSQYENFKNLIDYIKESSYDEKTKRINLLFVADFLPLSLRLNFKIDRITQAGVYRFEFDQGFLNGLKGEIQVSNYKGHCLFYSIATWKGPHTGYSPLILENISKTLAVIAIEKMFHLTQTLK